MMDIWLLRVAVKAGQWQIARMLVSRPTMPQVLWEHLSAAIKSRSELMVGVLLLSGKVSHEDAAKGVHSASPPRLIALFMATTSQPADHNATHMRAGLQMAASQVGHVELVDLLLHYGVDVNVVIDNKTALCAAKSKLMAERLLSEVLIRLPYTPASSRECDVTVDVSV
jgi:hypothetical protein